MILPTTQGDAGIKLSGRMLGKYLEILCYNHFEIWELKSLYIKKALSNIR